MKISIAERLKPFSHMPGTTLLLPGSGVPIQIYPCLIRFYQCQPASHRPWAELQLDLEGPVEQFTLTSDLEKGRLTVTGMTRKGWLRYHLLSSQDLKSIRFLVERAPSGGLPIQQESNHVVLQDKEWVDLFEQPAFFTPFMQPLCDRLSFGCHKAQEWEEIRRRGSLEEIFPLWHRLGQLVPQFSSTGTVVGTFALLEECEKQMKEGRPDAAQLSWRKLFLCGFRGMLVPQIEDTLHQGIISTNSYGNSDISPLALLSEGARLIRNFLIQQEKGSLSILPFLLPSLPFGRLVDVPLEGGGSISFEWSKKTIRRMCILSEQEGEIALQFRSNVCSFRLRQGLNDKGERRPRSSSLLLKKNCHYFIDNFL